MTEKKNEIHMSDDAIISRIYLIRGRKVILDKDIAAMYNLGTNYLNKAVKRNIRRFPEDFMFQLTKGEFENLMFQIGTSSSGWGGTRKMPYAFTEQGVAMLSGVLNSDIAIEVNIRIIRIFARLREMLIVHKELFLKLEELEKKTLANREDIQLIFDAIRELLPGPNPPRIRIGFRRSDEYEQE